MKPINPKKLLFIYLLVFVYPLIVRALHAEDYIFTHIAKRMLGGLQVIAHDAIIYFVILLLFYVSFLKRLNRPVSLIPRIIALGIFIVYVVDVIILKTFNTRLTIEDAFKYAAYAPQFIQQVYGVLTLSLIIFVVVLFCGLLLFILYHKPTLTPKAHRLFLLAFVLLLLAFSLGDRKGYVHSWVYKNFAEYNYSILSQATFYSDEFIMDFMANTSYKDALACTKHEPQRKNIIILMIESLSVYQSTWFSGIKNWTPHLDSIAKKNLSFKNFYANGFTTEDAELSMLTGKFPLYAPFRKTSRGCNSFQGYYGVSDSLPQVARRNGYTTEFITSADLNFSNTGNWAKSIGFNYIEGHTHPYYDNWTRYHFNAAPDEALYQRAFDRILQNQGKKNYLLFIKTATTHHPYINPENEEYSEAGTFRYVDKQLGLFYEKLLQSGFFKNGVLIIVGDHHAMIPLQRPEIEQFGESQALARVPMVVSFGDKKSAVEERPFQQVDICNSLKNLISDNQCTSAWAGDLLCSPGLPPQYIAFRRGDNRDIISVFYQGRELSVKLDGDKTRILNPDDVGDEILKSIVEKINKERIMRQVGG